MAILTLEVPDELAARLDPLQAELPQLLAYVVDLLGVPSSQTQEPKATSPLLVELLDFFASGPSLAEIADFKFSTRIQERLNELLYINREEELTEEQKAELDTFEQMNHLLILLKARVNRATAENNLQT